MQVLVSVHTYLIPFAPVINITALFYNLMHTY